MFIPAGAGEPVQIGGVVPGPVATGSSGEHALSNATGTTTMMAAADFNELRGLTMGKSLTRDQHDYARWIFGDFGYPRLHRRLEHFTDGFRS